MADALIALGGNIGEVRATLDRAVELFCDQETVRLIERSSDYRTPPWGIEDQPPFINLCIAVATELSPGALLERALAVERALGRDRSQSVRWGPRLIDIDIISYDDLVVDEPTLKLPHPRLFERAFVLVPLAEIAPDRIIAGVRIADALARLDASAIRRLPPRLSQLV